MAAPAINFTELLKEVPPGAWAAVWNDKVVACGADIQRVIREAKEKGIGDPVLMKAPEQPQTLFF